METESQERLGLCYCLKELKDKKETNRCKQRCSEAKRGEKGLLRVARKGKSRENGEDIKRLLSLFHRQLYRLKTSPYF
jgi:hypothetical protein